MNLLVYVVLLLIVSYPQIGHIRIMKYFGISQQGRREQIESDHTEEIPQKGMTVSRLQMMHDICSHNPISRFKDRFISKFQSSADLVTNMVPSGNGNITVEANGCKFYCFYETWYGLICSPKLRSF